MIVLPVLTSGKMADRSVAHYAKAVPHAKLRFVTQCWSLLATRAVLYCGRFIVYRLRNQLREGAILAPGPRNSCCASLLVRWWMVAFVRHCRAVSCLHLFRDADFSQVVAHPATAAATPVLFIV